LIDIDLADPAERPGPPSAHLLVPTALLVLLPLAFAAIAHHGWNDARSQTAEAERSIASASAREAAVAVEQRRAAAQQSILDGARALRAANHESLELIRLVVGGLPPSLQVSELVVDTDSIRIAGSAASASDISLWLARSSGRGGASLVWQGPELRQVGPDHGRVDFSLRILRTHADTDANAKRTPS